MNKKEQDALAVIENAWKNAPHRLISLWDMIHFIASKPITVIWGIDALLMVNAEAESVGGAGMEINEKNRTQSADSVELLEQLCHKLELADSEHQAWLLKVNLRNLEVPYFIREFSTGLNSVKYSIERELSDRKCVLLRLEQAKTLEHDDLFGEQVSTAIPSAVLDIRSAGNCLALDLHTAAVFHLMRTAEFGLRALAVSLNKTKIGERELEFVTWATIIDAISPIIEGKLKALNKVSVNQTEDEAKARYRGLLKDFQFLKDSKRNPIFHARKDYIGPEAQVVYLQIREFMRRLAEIISEK